MSQSTLDEDELFGEAANEIRTDVESSLDDAAAALPDADDIWNVEADNALGALNALRSALDAGDAEDDLRDAKKWYTMGVRADAFEDADDLEAEIARIEDAIEDIGDAKEQVGDLASTIPGLKNTLEELDAEPEEEEEEAEADEDDEEEEAEEAAAEA
ncbi:MULTISPECIES: DUF5790 family protein [Halorussus]|uniref:DUF5790 family protein n=1 Tax=Halorussus TaxID=1070314 RepID=UPI00209DE174|nr:DUF5790 family protein [Halorussus vallis]USZ74587.1 DUF5790 family protein [Halorussus vallis]